MWLLGAPVRDDGRTAPVRVGTAADVRSASPTPHPPALSLPTGPRPSAGSARIACATAATSSRRSNSASATMRAGASEHAASATMYTWRARAAQRRAPRSARLPPRAVTVPAASAARSHAASSASASKLASRSSLRAGARAMRGQRPASAGLGAPHHATATIVGIGDSGARAPRPPVRDARRFAECALERRQRDQRHVRRRLRDRDAPRAMAQPSAIVAMRTAASANRAARRRRRPLLHPCLVPRSSPARAAGAMLDAERRSPGGTGLARGRTPLQGSVPLS